MKIDKTMFPVHSIDLNNAKVLIRPNQAEGATGKNVIISDDRPLTVDNKILAREVIQEKTPDGKKNMLTPNFGMCQGRVLQRRKGSALYDRWIRRDDRVPRSKILLTEEGGIDQIFWLRFGNGYLIFGSSFLFPRIESFFVVID
jgi:hypothetical protein